MWRGPRWSKSEAGPRVHAVGALEILKRRSTWPMRRWLRWSRSEGGPLPMQREPG